MTICYAPQGVCSRAMTVEIEGDVIRRLEVEGGCSGNLQGISRLVEGMPVEEARRRLAGIRCGEKESSCPDQLSRALARWQQEQK